MPQSLTNIEVLITYSTKNREPIIDRELRKRLFSYLGGICKRLECYPIRIGGYVDHVHIYCRLSKKITLIKLVEELKKESSKWMKKNGIKYQNFYWQNGYHAVSINTVESDRLIKYIDNQEEHHKKKSYQEECRLFFEKYKMNYDEKYVWD